MKCMSCHTCVTGKKRSALRRGGIAQLGEHLLCKQGVSGSIPLISTILSTDVNAQFAERLHPALKPGSAP